MSLLQKSSSTPVPGTVPEIAADASTVQFMNGRLRDDLGLSAGDLRIGLTVAKNLLARNASNEAMRIYVALVLCEPANVDFQVGLANCASLIDRHELSLQAASAVIALAPSDSRGYLLSGRACLHLGSLADARQDLDDAVGLATVEGNAVVLQEARLLIDRLDLAVA